MGKIKGEPAEPWKPSIKQDSLVSKNKKRKEKRLSKIFTSQKIKTGEFIPVKKNSTPFNKLENVKECESSLSPKGKKANSNLSTSLPIKNNKKGKSSIANKSFASLGVTNKKEKKPLPSILSNPNTPKKNKNERVSFVNSRVNPVSFLDRETEEGEEPISCKTMKPYEKKGKRPIKRPAAFSDESDSESVNDAEDFLDMEASEGEETDEDMSKDEESDENTNVSNFDFEEESDEGNNDEEDEDNESEEDENEKSEDGLSDEPAPKPINAKKHSEKETVLTTKFKGAKLDKKPSVSIQQEMPVGQKVKANKMTQGTPKTNVTREQLHEKNKGSVQKLKQQSEKDPVKISESIGKYANAGFIRHIPKEISETDIIETLTKMCSADKIINIFLMKKNRHGKHGHAYIHFKDVESLQGVLNHEFTVKGFTFLVYKAKKEQILKPVAFLPNVSSALDNDSIKQAIEADVGPGNVTEFELKHEFEKRQTKNLLVYFSTIDGAKQAITKGEYKVNGSSVIVREAKESGIAITIYRVVVSGISEETTEEDLKKALEAKVGRDTVQSIRFSFTKHSFAFIVLKTEEAQKKALELEDSLTVNNAKLKVIQFVPRKGKNRGQRAGNKKRSNTNSEGTEDLKPPNAKKMKLEETTNVGEKLNKNMRKKKKASTSSTNGEVKAKKNRRIKGKPVNLIKNQKVANSSSDTTDKRVKNKTKLVNRKLN